MRSIEEIRYFKEGERVIVKSPVSPFYAKCGKVKRMIKAYNNTCRYEITFDDGGKGIVKHINVALESRGPATMAGLP